MLYVLTITNFIMNMGFAYVIPFYPAFANQKAGLDFSLIGIIMSTNSIGSVGFGYIFG